MAIRIIATVVGLVLLVLILVGVKGMQFKAMADMGASMVPPPEVISSTEVKQESWEQTIRSVGSLEALQGVTITAEFTGRVKEILFESGATVAAGDVLIRQDTASEEASLRSARAGLALAKANLSRARELLAKKVTSQSQYDAAEAEFEAAKAQVENVQVMIDRKTIRAPFAGQLGIRKINIGEDLAPGQQIVTLQTADTMLVNFNVPQRYLSLLEMDQVVRVNSNAVPGQPFAGKVTAISPEVDVKSRNVSVQAELKNSQGKLRPGMFASVEVVMPEERQVTFVPTTAIQYATFGDSVFIIAEKEDASGLEAQQQFVQLGEARGDFVEILAGVKPGTQIATAGLFKLRNGASVALQNDLVPEYEKNPQPADR